MAVVEDLRDMFRVSQLQQLRKAGQAQASRQGVQRINVSAGAPAAGATPACASRAPCEPHAQDAAEGAGGAVGNAAERHMSCCRCAFAHHGA